MNLRFPKGFFSRAMILILLGVVLSSLTRPSPYRSGLIALVDAFFLIGMVFLVFGIMHLLGNARMFASTTYSFKTIKSLFRGEMKQSDEMKEDYLEYRANQKTYDDVPHLLITALIFIAASIGTHLIFG